MSNQENKLEELLEEIKEGKFSKEDIENFGSQEELEEITRKLEEEFRKKKDRENYKEVKTSLMIEETYVEVLIQEEQLPSFGDLLKTQYRNLKTECVFRQIIETEIVSAIDGGKDYALFGNFNGEKLVIEDSEKEINYILQCPDNTMSILKEHFSKKDFPSILVNRFSKEGNLLDQQLMVLVKDLDEVNQRNLVKDELVEFINYSGVQEEDYFSLQSNIHYLNLEPTQLVLHQDTTEKEWDSVSDDELEKMLSDNGNGYLN